MSPESQDEFEQRLRRVLREHRHTQGGVDHTLTRVHEGFRRRQRRRAATSAVGAVVLVVGVASYGAHLVSQRDSGRPDTQLLASGSITPALTTPAPEPDTSLAISPGQVATDLVPLSVTAISPDSFWVLAGSKVCPAPSTVIAPSCTVIKQTVDGGRSFGTAAAPAAPPGHLNQLRFANAKDGWAFGVDLWGTHDGGISWRQAKLPGGVEHLAASGGTVWALAVDGEQLGLYRSSYTGDAWTRVDLPVALTQLPAGGDLAVQGGAVVITGQDAQGRAYTLTSRDGSPFAASRGPCNAEGLGSGEVSASAQAFWLACNTGTASSLWRSTDDGATWQQVPLRESLPNGITVAARDAQHAVIAAGSGGLYQVDADGTLTAVGPQVPQDTWTSASDWSAIGFTNPQVGYATSTANGSPTLWRTTDGGNTWRVVTF